MNDEIGSGGVGGGDKLYTRSAEPVLVPLLNSYSLLESILVDASGPSSCPI